LGFLAALVVAVSLLPLGARLWWVLELTTHFRLQYLAAIATTLVLVALRRRWRLAAALCVAATINVWPVLPYLPRPSPDSPAIAAVATGTPFKILAVNVSFRQFSARRFLQIVDEAAPDVLLVVEFTPHAAEVLAKLDEKFTQHLKLPAEGPYGIALWSRFELESATSFSLGRVPAIEARVRSPHGTFTLLGAHLSAPISPRRAAQRQFELARLAERRAQIAGPVIVAGDLNVTPYSPFYTDWLTTTGLTDSRHHRTLSVSWPAVLPILGIPIDHVAVSDEFQILAHRRLPNFDSDHYGIIAELALGNGKEHP
jgi:endonuclease/exonuclease/phosphatase (EEP) superfamily protein YafD